MIKETLRTSRNVNSLTDFQFRVWVHLISYVDDFGRGSADAELLKGLLFPRRHGVTVKQIQDAIGTLASKGMVILYESDGEPYFYFPKWGEHQRIRNKVSKFPEPAADCGELPQVAADCGELPLETKPSRNQEETKREAEAKTHAHAREDEADELFQSFWDAYPRKTGDIREAYFEYQHAVESVEPQMLVDCAKKYAETLGRDETRFAPSADKWLRNQGWKEVKNGQSVSASAQNSTSAKRYNIHYDVDGS